MSYYGISAVKLDYAGVEVEEAKVHRITRSDPAGPFEYDVGTAMPHHEVANLVVSGDKVYVLEVDGPGSFRPTDKVRVKPGQMEYLESYRADGAATTALLDLPKWQ